MGTCHSRDEFDSSYRISKAEFDFFNMIGRGALGRVWRVLHKHTKRQFAIKEYQKENIPSVEALNSILNERSLLSIMHFPFIVNVNFAFQDMRKLYLGLDLKLGGDLRYHMLRKKFTEAELKFILACILQALEYIHSKHIIHKDIKPENIILDNAGYAFLTDFGTAELLKLDNSSCTSGTPAYMAPEIICRQNHGVVSDFFAIGVILYENIMGDRPYNGKSRKEIREMMLEHQAKIDVNHVPEGWSAAAADICNRLLKRKPNFRLGYKGIQEIKNHVWFNDIDQDSLSNFELKAPFAPQGSENFDHYHVNNYQSRFKNKLKTSKNDFVGYFFSPKVLVKS